MDNFTIDGNSLGAMYWSGDTTWYTGYGSRGKYEQLDCGARFKTDVNAYLSSANSTYKNIQVRLYNLGSMLIFPKLLCLGFAIETMCAIAERIKPGLATASIAKLQTVLTTLTDED